MSDKTEPFLHSQTKENLMRAFAGESQARSRYTIAANYCRKADLAVIEGVFLFTADTGSKPRPTILPPKFPRFGRTDGRVDGTYPVDLFSDLRDYLRAAQHNEYQEWEHDYAQFARTAIDEGFPLVGKLFEHIARVEQTHGDRFGRFADLLEQEQLFLYSGGGSMGPCLNCGFVVTSTAAPAHCPVCHHPQGYFVRVELSPWS